MKKLKTINPFYFRDQSHQQVVDILNKELPISIKNNQDLVERVHQRYPLINKSEVAVIIKAVFSSFRDLLIMGKILNFNNLFFDTKLLFFKYRHGGHILPSLKVHITTPPPLRKKEEL